MPRGEAMLTPRCLAKTRRSLVQFWSERVLKAQNRPDQGSDPVEFWALEKRGLRDLNP
jgi:hypothetical protein